MEVVGEVQLRRGVLLHADALAGQVGGRADAEAALHHEALPVVEGDPGEQDVVGALAAERPGRIAAQHVDLAVLERVQPRLRRLRHELHLAGIAEHGGRHGTAEVDVEPAPATGGVDFPEAGVGRARATTQSAPLAHCRERHASDGGGLADVAGLHRGGRIDGPDQQTADGNRNKPQALHLLRHVSPSADPARRLDASLVEKATDRSLSAMRRAASRNGASSAPNLAARGSHARTGCLCG